MKYPNTVLLPLAASLLLAVTSAGAAGCATTGGSTVDISKAETPAEQRYLLGQSRFERGDHEGAIEAYDKVRNDYPYSRFATLAQLRIGDAYFEQEQYSSAAEQYRSFVKLHPNHPKVPYARFRRAKAIYEKMPENWFFMPPAHQRDLSSTETAARHLQDFQRRHPESKYAEEARKLLAETRRRLADHEMYVAEFYLERDNPRAAAMRLKYLLNNYSGLGLDAKALYLLARSYLELGDTNKAKVALEDLIEFHPSSEYAGRARSYLEEHELAGKN